MNLPILGSHWLVRPSPHLLGSMRHAVHELLASAGVDQECRERTVMACDELLCNAFDQLADQAMVSVCVNTDHVRIAVTDPRPVDPLAGWKRDDPMAGLTLVRQLSRDFYVRRLGDGNTVAAEIARRDFFRSEIDVVEPVPDSL